MLQQQSSSEVEERKKALAEANRVVKRMRAEKKQRELEAAKKAKNKAGKKQKMGGKEDGSERQTPMDMTNEIEEEEGEEREEFFDTSTPEGYKAALRSKMPLPFLVGPVEFSGLNLTEE